MIEREARGDENVEQQVLSLLAVEESRLPDFLRTDGSPPWVSPEYQPGDLVDRYLILRRLGSGGMGTVYLAERDGGHYRQRVALKVIQSALASSELIYRFRNERQILAGLNHPNIARLQDGGEHAGRPYAVIEYVDGLPIDHYCDQNRLDVRQRIQLFLSVCNAVATAHRAPVVHRDLKPANVLVKPSGVPKLLDFGIAKLLEPDPSRSSRSLTRLGSGPGTPDFASPEQLAGSTSVGTTSDVFSLGAMLYYLLTGVFPQRPQGVCGSVLGDGVRAAASKVVLDSTAPSRVSSPVERAASRASDPKSLSRELVDDVDAVLSRAMAPEPPDRYQTVDSMSDDLKRFLQGEPVRARFPSRLERVAKLVRRYPVTSGFIALAVSLILLSWLTTLTQWRVAVAQRTAAEEQTSLARTERQSQVEVTEFLEEILEGAQVENGAGPRTTIQEVLDAAAVKIEDEDLAPLVQAAVATSIGRSYLSLGLYDRAKKLLELALRCRELVLPEGHGDIADTLAHLAEVSFRQADYESAAQLLERALRIWADLGTERALARYRIGRNNLATLLTRTEKFERALEIYREVLAERRASPESSADQLASSLHNLGSIEVTLGRPEEGLRHLRAAYRLRLEELSPSHPQLAISISALARANHWAGRPIEAERLFREVVALRRELYPNGHKDVAKAINNLAFLLTERGQPGEAKRAYEEALEILAKRPMPELEAIAKRNLANLYLRLDRLEAANLLVKEALSRLCADAPSSWRCADARAIAAEVGERLGRHSANSAELLDQHHRLVNAWGPSPTHRRSSFERVVRHFERLGRSELAQTWRDRQAQYLATLP